MADTRAQARPELTLRAVGTGILLGALLTPCNVYSGLKIGWSFNMSIAAGLLGFGLWRLGQAMGTRPWAIHENNINQTTASSAASIISGGLVAPIPALAMLTGQELAWSLLAAWVFVVSILGVVVAAGLRNQLLLRERLRFPAGVATAETIREIHAKGVEAAGKLRTLIAAGAVSAGLKLAADMAALGRLAPSVSLPAAGALKAGGTTNVTAANLGFMLDPSLLMAGFGAIIGLRAGLSLLLGAVAGWGVLAPWLLARGWAEPGAADPGAPWFASLVEWLLWPGVTLMVVASLTAFAISFARLALRRRERVPAVDAPVVLPRWLFVGALVVTTIAASVAQVEIFGIAAWAAVLAVLVSFVLALVAARVSGETAITPIGAMGKITQLTYGVVTPGDMTANLMSANVTGGAAGQAADLLHDLRTGEMIGATPRFQVVAQVFGVLTGSMVGALVYLILIPNPAEMLITAEWPAPAVAVWKSVAEVLSQGVGAIPEGALPAMYLAAALGLGMALAEKLLPLRIARLMPSAPAMGLAFVIPAWNSLSMALGALAAAVLGLLAPDWAERRVLPLAAGLVAGESLMGVGLAGADMLG